MVTTPVEWLIGVDPLAAGARRHRASRQVVDRALDGLGQQPFYPPDVGGWPHGQAWLSTASAGVRLRVAADTLAQAGDLSTVSDAAATDRLDAAGYLIGVGAWTDRTAAALKPSPAPRRSSSPPRSTPPNT